MGLAMLFSRDLPKFVLYRYHPSLVAGVIFAILFMGTTFFHVYQAARKGSMFLIPLIIGGFFEIGGYIARALAHNNQTSLSIYVVQIILLLVAPALFAASIYMVLGRLILVTQGESMAPIRAKWLTKIFVCGDVLSFLVQSAGGSMVSKASSINNGKHLIVVGLFLQIIFFGIFLVTSLIFDRRLRKTPTPASSAVNWQKYMLTLYFTGILILIRSVFRVVEFTGGNDGPLMTSEVYLYVFDAILMLGVLVSLNVVHPGDIIGKKAQDSMMVLNDRDTSTEAFGRK
ncbi:RTA1-domain-containing protein [Stipitochalara longipes BDJ]|nr:RTA1-domain-containing protein [Stipitochalara longipes BDJ]